MVEYLDHVCMREYGTAPIGLAKFGMVLKFLCSRLHENCGTIPNGSGGYYREEGVKTIHILTSFITRFLLAAIRSHLILPVYAKPKRNGTKCDRTCNGTKRTRIAVPDGTIYTVLVYTQSHINFGIVPLGTVPFGTVPFGSLVSGV